MGEAMSKRDEPKVHEHTRDCSQWTQTCPLEDHMHDTGGCSSKTCTKTAHLHDGWKCFEYKLVCGK
jgi:hypothetical protein